MNRGGPRSPTADNSGSQTVFDNALWRVSHKKGQLYKLPKHGKHPDDERPKLMELWGMETRIRWRSAGAVTFAEKNGKAKLTEHQCTNTLTLVCC